MQNKLFIAIPLLDELSNLDSLFSCLDAQQIKNFSVYFCVNQADNWWDDENKIEICKRNQLSIKYIENKAFTADYNIVTIDKSSKGKAWKGKKIGVGWARKTLMDTISETANNEDIIISLDGDTSFNPQYFETIIDFFNKSKSIDTLSIPYYHPLGNNEVANRAILRYEIYMRYYFLNLIRINSIYAFSALGSAIAFRHKALKTIGGFTPKKSGEDFYFLQKMIKHKPIGNYLKEKVYPAARFSNRVFFGTGPAMIKGSAGNWESYPLYPMSLFDKVKEFYDIIPLLYEDNISTPIDSFWLNIDSRNQIFDKIRKNSKDVNGFTKSILQYFDALRMLQFLKANYDANNEEYNLIEFLNSGFAKGIDDKLLINIDFNNSSLEQLNAIRDYLCKLEDKQREIISNF